MTHAYTRRRAILSLLAVTALIGPLYFWWDSAQGGTAHRISSEIAGLRLAGGKVLEFEDDRSKTHADRLVRSRLEFPHKAFDALVQAAREEGYVWLESNDPNAFTIRDIAPAPSSALYRLRGSVESGTFDLVVLVPSERQVVIRAAGS